MPLRAGAGKRIFKKLAIGAPIASGLGLLAAGGIAAGTAHSMMTEEPRETPFMDALFEGVIGDPQADRHILGTDVGLGTFYAWPGALRAPQWQRNLALVNPTTFGDIAQSDAANLPGAGYSQMTKDLAEQRIQPRSSVMRNYNATGDIVFGMYNSRLG